jgi:hypothetical protein
MNPLNSVSSSPIAYNKTTTSDINLHHIKIEKHRPMHKEHSSPNAFKIHKSILMKYLPFAKCQEMKIEMPFLLNRPPSNSRSSSSSHNLGNQSKPKFCDPP